MQILCLIFKNNDLNFEKALRLNMTSTIQIVCYKSERIKFSLLFEESYNKTVFDFNFGRHNELFTLKS